MGHLRSHTEDVECSQLMVLKRLNCCEKLFLSVETHGQRTPLDKILITSTTLNTVPITAKSNESVPRSIPST